MNKKVLLPGVLVAGLMFSGTATAAEPDNNTVDGNATYFNLGKLVPSKIEYAGYDARNMKLYMNVDIEDQGGADLPATVDYYINVFDENGDTFLNNTSRGTRTAEGGANVLKATDENEIVTLTKALEAYHRVVVTIDNDEVFGAETATSSTVPVGDTDTASEQTLRAP